MATRRPTPGIQKTDFITTAPLTRRLKMIPMTVTIGIITLASACLPTTTDLGSPFGLGGADVVLAQGLYYG